MKIRTSFVTNSSSSSYIIAIKKDITAEEIDNIFAIYFDKTYDYLVEHGYHDNAYEDYTKEDFKRDLFDTSGCDMDLGDWIIKSGWCSNEDDFEQALLYEAPGFETPKFKLGGGY